MGENLVIADHDADPPGVRARRGLIAILEIALAAAEQRELHAVAQNGRNGGEQEIEPFLPGQAADHAEQRCVVRGTRD